MTSSPISIRAAPSMIAGGTIHEFRLTLGDDSSVLLRGRIVRSEQKTNEDGSSIFVTGVQFVDDEPGEESGSIGDLIGKIR